MEGLKKNIFWVLIAVVVVGAGIFWALGVYLKQDEVETEKGQYTRKLGELDNIAAKLDEKVKNQSDIDKAAEQLNSLQKMQQGIRERLEVSYDDRMNPVKVGMNPDIRPASFTPQPDLNDLTLFRRWIDDKYSMLMAEAKTNGMIVRNEGPKTLGQTALDDINQMNIHTVLKQYVILREIYAVLGSVKVNVAAVETDPDTRDERPVIQARGVQILERFEFLTADELKQRRLNRPGAMTMGVDEDPPAMAEPFEKHGFEIEFVAHYSAVPEILRRLIATSKFFLVVKRMDIRRQPQDFGSSRGGAYASRRRTQSSAEVMELRNTREWEAPTVVVLECQVYEFSKFAETAEAPGNQR
ncbi:MAG: hypothetical protein JW909_03870 [Planctomycetes bacterium]|nr:hypothetical protein [Planctomycetota bacterium]